MVGRASEPRRPRRTVAGIELPLLRLCWAPDRCVNHRGGLSSGAFRPALSLLCFTCCTSSVIRPATLTEIHQHDDMPGVCHYIASSANAPACAGPRQSALWGPGSALLNRTLKGIAMVHFYPNERLAIFIDGANLYATAKALGFDIDYKRLLALFRTKGQLVRALYYTAIIEDQEFSSIRPLVDWLDYNGYTMVTKPTKEFTDGLGRRKIKGNMDIELTVDAMRLVEHLEHIILFTGDGDFRALVAAMQMRGCRVSVVSTLQTQPPMVADELRRQADQFIDLADLETQICRDPATRPRFESPGMRDTRQRAGPVPAVLDFPEEGEDGR